MMKRKYMMEVLTRFKSDFNVGNEIQRKNDVNEFKANVGVQMED